MKERYRSYSTEEKEWMSLTPRRRFIESFRLFDYYRKTGGSLAPEIDSQSPFHFPEYYKQNIVFKKIML